MFVMCIIGSNWELDYSTLLELAPYVIVGQAHETVTTIHVKKSFLLGSGLMLTSLYHAVRSS